MPPKYIWAKERQNTEIRLKQKEDQGKVTSTAGATSQLKSSGSANS